MRKREADQVKIANSSGNYFSFPSFEDFGESEEERIDGRIAKGVP
jgi:hypothetical protein